MAYSVCTRNIISEMLIEIYIMEKFDFKTYNLFSNNFILCYKGNSKRAALLKQTTTSIS